MKLITIKEVSKMLGVKESTLYEWVRNGTIPSYRLNGRIRFNIDEIRLWVKASHKYSDTNNTKERRSHKKAIKNKDLDTIITNAVEAINVKGYNSSQRETRENQAHKKGGG